jgi:hypothetical protein
MLPAEKLATQILESRLPGPGPERAPKQGEDRVLVPVAIKASGDSRGV